jgi:hypothetical protein
MRPVWFFSVAATSVLSITGLLLADPTDNGRLKLWVQVYGYDEQGHSMLRDLASGDARVKPILRVDVNGFLSPNCYNDSVDNALHTSGDWIRFDSPEFAADAIVCKLGDVTQDSNGNRFVANPLDIAIQLGGFGTGSRPDSGSGWGDVVALARPHSCTIRTRPPPTIL